MVLSQSTLFVLIIVSFFGLSKQQIYNNCEQFTQDVGTSEVDISEANSQADVDNDQARYTVNLPFNSVIETIVFANNTRNTGHTYPPTDYFRLIRNTGIGQWQVQMIKSIDRDGDLPLRVDDVNSIEYVLSCQDNTNTNPFFPLLKFQILDLNDNAPVFVDAPYKATVNELTPVGTTVFRSVSATDKDRVQNAVIEYTMLPGDGGANDGFNKFAILTPSQGIVTISQTLDFEAVNDNGAPYYIVKIQASDQPDPPTLKLTAETYLNITITDGDDQGPIFEYTGCRVTTSAPFICFNPEYTVNVVTGSTTGNLEIHSVPDPNNIPVTIGARDQDSLRYPIRFSIEQTTPPSLITTFNPLRSNNPNQGSLLYTTSLSLNSAITKADVIDNEFQIVIRATEQGQSSGPNRFQRAIIRGRVLPANNFPPDISTSSGQLTGYIREDAKRKDHVRDSNLINSFQLIISDRDVVRVKAGDKGNPPCERFEVLTVNVRRNMFCPIWSNTNRQYTATIFETHGLNNMVTKLTATDADQNPSDAGRVTYRLANNSLNADNFYINDYGEVFAKRSLIGLTGDPYVLTILAQDNYENICTSEPATLTVTVIRNTFPPEFIGEPYAVTVDSNIQLNQPFFQVRARDNDTKSPYKDITFRIIGDGDSETYFDVNSVSGQISTKTDINNVNIQNFYMIVQARDGGNPSMTDFALIHITVTRNLLQTRILEIQKLGETFFTAQINDSDQSSSNKTLEYSLTSDTVNADCRSFFGITKNGGLYVHTDLVGNHNNPTRYICEIRAQGLSNSSRYSISNFTVEITVVRNTAPRFVFPSLGQTFYTATVDRAIRDDILVGTFTVYDKDIDVPFNQLQYQVTGAGKAMNFFAIKGSNEVIVSDVAGLAADSDTSYILQLYTRDGGRSFLSDQTEMRIRVIRNLHTPIFTAPFIEVNITQLYPAGNFITMVSATDDDPKAPANEFSYSARDPRSQAAEYLYVHATTGKVSLLKSVKDMTNRTLDFFILATDHGFPALTGTATVRVNVHFLDVPTSSYPILWNNWLLTFVSSSMVYLVHLSLLEI
ncbi:cadherin-99C-like [Gigantopelta aegis]|uniref:cadherin-99C-like n=1 Tax=Gigantopelta aegis TaxID=1735272 RepID=UPI001B88E049|nr:cadherin-99C-like [Gigantopelta aegis]